MLIINSKLQIPKMENNNTNTRKWLKSHHDTLFPFFPFLKKRNINWLFDKLREKEVKRVRYMFTYPSVRVDAPFVFSQRSPRQEIR